MGQGNWEAQRVQIGTEGRRGEALRPVAFIGEKLATVTVHDYNHRQEIQTLYKVQGQGGAWVVHVQQLSQWEGESQTYALRVALLDDLDVGGEFETLGRAAGYARDLTISEALAACGEDADSWDEAADEIEIR